MRLSKPDHAQSLRDAPSDEAARLALIATLPDFAELHRRLNAALAGNLPRTFRRRPQRLACDLVLIPYHGQPLHDPEEIYRSQAKSGTSHFHAYATLYVIHNGYRFTVALTAVSRGRALGSGPEASAAPGHPVGIGCRLLLLDRGFYSVGVIRHLQAARHPFLMPVICHGRNAGHPKGPSGSNVFKLMKKSGWFTHTLGTPRRRESHRRDLREARPDDGSAWEEEVGQLGVCLLGDHSQRVDWVKQTYRKRFGIETSYRQMNQCRIRTTTKKFNVRFLYVAIALLLRNLWVWLHYFVLSSPLRGCRRYNWDRLPVERMPLWLEQVAAEMYGLILTITTERDIPKSVTT